jgi:cytochrome o ubiquinol oxidase subunit 2
MRFRFFGMSAEDFERWVQKARAGGQALDRDTYLRLERPSEREPVRPYGTVAPGLFDAVVNRCVAPGTQCLHAVMAADMRRVSLAQNWRPDAFVCTAADPATIALLPTVERK